MIKIRLTFVDDEDGNFELDHAMRKLEHNFEIISVSKVYKGRGDSKYSNIYIDVENKL